MQPDPTPTHPDAMRQEIDVRYVVTSLEGDAERLYEGVYCQRGQAENLIKLHKAQLASDRTSCHVGDGQSGAPDAAHGGVLADAHGARGDPAGPRAGESRVQYDAPAPAEDRGPRRRAWQPHPRAPAVELPEKSLFRRSRSA